MLAECEDYDLREKIGGVEYLMSPPSTAHIRIRKHIEMAFHAYLAGKRCEAFSEIGVWLNDEDMVIPDVLIVCDKDKIKYDGIHGAPDLIVEILSPATSKKDRTVKLKLYEQSGVKEYWIVSPKGKSIDVYKLQDGKFEMEDVYHLLEPYEWNMLSEEEQAKQKLFLKVSLYNDLELSLQDIFKDT